MQGVRGGESAGAGEVLLVPGREGERRWGGMRGGQPVIRELLGVHHRDGAAAGVHRDGRECAG